MTSTAAKWARRAAAVAGGAAACVAGVALLSQPAQTDSKALLFASQACSLIGADDVAVALTVDACRTHEGRAAVAAAPDRLRLACTRLSAARALNELVMPLVRDTSTRRAAVDGLPLDFLMEVARLNRGAPDGNDGTHAALADLGAALASAGLEPQRALLLGDAAGDVRTDHWQPRLSGLRLLEAVGPPGAASGGAVVSLDLHRVLTSAALRATASVLAADATSHERALAQPAVQLLPLPALHAAADHLGRLLTSSSSSGACDDVPTFTAVRALSDAVRARLRHPRTSEPTDEAAVRVLSSVLARWPAALLARACRAADAPHADDDSAGATATAAVHAAASLCDTLTALEHVLGHGDGQLAGDDAAALRQQAAAARQHAVLLLPALHALAVHTLAPHPAAAADDGSTNGEHYVRPLRHAIVCAVSSVLCLNADGTRDAALSRLRRLRLHAFTVLSLHRAPLFSGGGDVALRGAAEYLSQVAAAGGDSGSGGTDESAVDGMDALVADAVAHATAAASAAAASSPSTAAPGGSAGGLSTRHQPRVTLLDWEEADTLTSAEDDQRRSHPTVKGRAALLSRYASLLSAAAAGEADVDYAVPSAIDPASGTVTPLAPSWVDVLLCWTRQRSPCVPLPPVVLAVHVDGATADPPTSLLAALLGRRVEADTRRWAQQHYFRPPAFRAVAESAAAVTPATATTLVADGTNNSAVSAAVSPHLTRARALIAQQWLLSSLYGTVAPPPSAVDDATTASGAQVAPHTLAHVRGVVARELCRWMPRHTQWKRREPGGSDVPADALPPFVQGELVRRVQAAAHGPAAALPPLHCDAFTPPLTVSVPLQVHALKAAAFVAGVGPWRSATSAAELAVDLDGGDDDAGGGTSLVDAAWLRSRLVAQGAHVAAGYLAEALTARLADLAAAPRSPASSDAAVDDGGSLLPSLSPALLACMSVAAEATAQYRDASAALRQSVRFLANLAYVPPAVVVAASAARVDSSSGPALVACAARVRGAAALAGGAAAKEDDAVTAAGAGRLASLAGVWASAGNMKLRGHALRLVTNLQLSGGGSARGAAAAQVGDHVVPIYDSDHGVGDLAAVDGTAASADAGGDVSSGVDIVLVHGLQGGAVKTWRCPGVDPFGNGADGHDYRDEACAAAAGRGSGGDDDAGIDWAAARQYIVRDGERAAFWPSLWLAPDLSARLGRERPQSSPQSPPPRVRLYGVTYDADVWLSDSVRPTAGVPAVAHDVAAQLLEAGVGAGGRPVVFLCHSLGGILTKYMLLLPPGALPQAAAAAAAAGSSGDSSGAGNELARRTAGVVFYGTPHCGAEVAAKALAGLQSMLRWLRTPDPHPLVTPHVRLLQDTRQLSALNARFGDALVRQATEPLPVRLLPADEDDEAGSGARAPLLLALPTAVATAATGGGRIAVLSVAETLPCDVQQAMGFAPRRERRGGGTVDAPGRLSVLVVPPSSADPGYGAFAAAPGSDHISVCKPGGVWDLRYTLARDLVLEAAAAYARA
jgi:hypothetical protein